MKTALSFVLVAFAGVGGAAVAQQPAPSYDPAYYEVAPGVAAQQPNHLPGDSQALGAMPQAAPTSQSPVLGENPPIDGSLMDGALLELGCSICGDGNCAPAEWYLEQDVRILNRSRSRRLGIAYDFGQSPNIYGEYPEVLNVHSVTPDISTAWGMTLGHHFARDTQNRDHFVEFSFWGLNGWDDSATVHGTRLTFSGIASDTSYGSLNSAYYFAPDGSSLLGFNYADLQTIEYTSSTNNFELNGRFTHRNRSDRLVAYPDGRWRRECQPGMHLSYLYGLRFLKINEGFRFHGESRIDESQGGVVVSSTQYTGDYNISAHNNILGFQVGAEMNFHQCRWMWGIRSKIGPYVNFANQVSDISAGVALNPDYVRRVSGFRNEASLIGEVGFQAAYKFRPNLVGRAAYDFMWVTGVASAPDQMQFEVEPVDQVNTNGLAFFQGVTLGLEWLW